MKGLVEKIESILMKKPVAASLCGVVGGTSYYFTNQYFGEPMYHLSGFITSAVASVIDFASTLPAIKITNTKEFKESGLEDYYEGETNPIIGNYPTVNQFYKKCALLGLLALGLSTICPPIGHGYLSFASLAAYNNKKKTKELKNDLASSVNESFQDYKNQIEKIETHRE